MRNQGGTDPDAATDAALQDHTSAPRPSWLREARRRGVLRVATSYAVIAWLLVQIGDTTFQPLGVPAWVFPALIVTAALGFPVALALAWFLELTPRGVEIDTAPASAPRPHVHGLRRYADVVIIAVLLVVVGVLLTRDRVVTQEQAVAPGALSARAVAVLPFQDLTGAPQGSVLAPGIAEAVLHQLASLHEIDVIARTSSFAFQGNEDVRVIGQKLNARYLLEGSVQSDGKRLRVTAQLVDAVKGGDLWSLRFDRTVDDIFAVQDEIALAVARALRIVLDPAATEKLTGQGTKNIDAYLEYMEARNLLGDFRVADMSNAIEHLNNALRSDPEFADAYALLAGAEVHRAEYEVSDDRLVRLREALDRADVLVARALELDPDNADAFIQRAYLRSFTDGASAEEDYRHGIELNPNSALACEGLASVLNQDPLRRDEVLELLDRARRLDPLEPRIDVLKAVFLYYSRGQASEAAQVLESVLERNPGYLPALARLANIRIDQLEFAESARLATKALTLDPANEEVRGTLIRDYLGVGDPDAAERVAAAAPTKNSGRMIPVLLYRNEIARAAEAAYAAYDSDTVTPLLEGAAVGAVCMDARTRGEYARAIYALESASGVTWDEQGRAVLGEDEFRIPFAETCLASLLLASNDTARGRSLLEALLARSDYLLATSGRGSRWDSLRPATLALLGRSDEALTELERRANSMSVSDSDPTWDSIRADPRFQKLVADGRETAVRQQASQRVLMDRLRAAGELPQP